MTSSYQHSYPEHGPVEPDMLQLDGQAQRPPIAWRAALALGVLLLGSLALLDNHADKTVAKLAQPQMMTAQLAGGGEDPPGPPKPKEFDWKRISEKFDWQKCQGSDDPDCWKKEGDRVHSYWSDFGSKMRTYWSDFGQKMRNFWAGLFGPKPAPESPPPPAPADDTSPLPPPPHKTKKAPEPVDEEPVIKPKKAKTEPVDEEPVTKPKKAKTHKPPPPPPEPVTNSTKKHKTEP